MRVDPAPGHDRGHRGRAGARNSIGSQLLDRLVEAGFTGSIYPVNPNVRDPAAPHGLPVGHRGAGAGRPRRHRRAGARRCSTSSTSAREAGVKALLVVSSGFRRGRAARGSGCRPSCCAGPAARGMRVVGPNSFGLINNDPAVRLNASLAPTLPPHGRLGLFAQSGALGIAVLASAARRNLGISVVRGRPATGSTCPATTSCSTGSTTTTPTPSASTWSRWATRASSPGSPATWRSIKPVIVVKSGVSAFGVPPGHRARATPSARPEAFDAMLRQAGVIRVENVHQLFDVAQLVAHQPLPARQPGRHRRQLHALGTLTADACISWGLEVSHGPVVAAHRGHGRRVPHGARRRLRRPRGRLAC